jgi:hypothetical protein
MPMHAWLPSIPPPCVDGPSLALLSRTRRGLLAAVSTALVLSACAAPGASVGPVLDVPLSPANAATHVLLADFESQAALTGERVVIPTPAQPKVPGRSNGRTPGMPACAWNWRNPPTCGPS